VRGNLPDDWGMHGGACSVCGEYRHASGTDPCRCDRDAADRRRLLHLRAPQIEALTRAAQKTRPDACPQALADYAIGAACDGEPIDPARIHSRRECWAALAAGVEVCTCSSSSARR
jgi:hypothetical protein